MLPVLVALLVVVPLVEIFVLIQVGQLLGAVPTVLLLLAMSILGSVLLKREGTRTWRAFQGALSSHRMPAKEVADGALVIFGGALLLTPGFVTDAVGLACVLPGSRSVVRRVLLGLVAKRFGLAGVAGAFAADRFGAARPPAGRRARDGSVIEGEVVDGEDPRWPGHDGAPPSR
jgi:UPF0716 protein FxsA